MWGGKTYPTVDEAISYLKRSDLPTIITEGKDDVVVFRRFEDDLNHLGVDIMAVGDRNAVLALFERRHEMKRDKGVVFIADRDVWVYGDVPEEFDDKRIVFSHGYSIENDLVSDGDVEALMSRSEREKFSQEVTDFVEYYALALSRHLINSADTICVSPSQYFQSLEERNRLLKLRNGENYPAELRDNINSNYVMLLRGKQLLALVVRQLSHSSRVPKHSKLSILEQSASRSGPLLTATRSKVEAALL